VASILGCAAKYEVLITYRANGAPLGTFEVETIVWDRRIDDISEARVDLPADCCGVLAFIRPWAHELHVIRDGSEVWVGPVVVDASCRSGKVIVARDMLQWLTRRVIHSDHISASQGSVPVAAELVTDGFAPDDPDVLPYLTTYGTGVLGGREYLTNSGYVYDALKDLAKGSLDYTTVGRRIILMESGHSLGRTALLTCEHFGGDVCVTGDGTSVASRGVVTGKEDSGVSGSSGGVDSFIGLVEVLHKDDRIVSSATAADQARGLVTGPDRVLVQPPDGSSLSPEAPVSIHELVPGMTVPVFLECTCRTASQDMRLTKLVVRFDADGETVQPYLQPVGVGVDT
jgi:hypothetical protein